MMRVRCSIPRRRSAYSGLAAALVLGLGGCSTGPPEPRAEDLARGEVLYDRHCVACHGGSEGGSISDIPPRHNAEGHTWHHADCELVDLVLEGMPPREGYPVMPAFEGELEPEDVEAILAFIKTWWEPEQRQVQSEVTEERCAD